jgi:hypothetical protein
MHARIVTYSARCYVNLSLGGEPKEQPLPRGQGADDATLPDGVLRGAPGAQRSRPQLAALGSGIAGKLRYGRHAH